VSLTLKWSSRSFEVIGVGAFQYAWFPISFPLWVCLYLAPFLRHCHLFTKKTKKANHTPLGSIYHTYTSELTVINSTSIHTSRRIIVLRFLDRELQISHKISCSIFKNKNLIRDFLSNPLGRRTDRQAEAKHKNFEGAIHVCMLTLFEEQQRQ